MGLLVVGARVLAVLAAGVELCECEEVVLLVAERAVPLVVGAAAVDAGGERFELELEGGTLGGLLLDLRVEPTSLRKRWFMWTTWTAAEGAWQEERTAGLRQAGRVARGERLE